MKVFFGDDFDGAKEAFLECFEQERKKIDDVEWYQAKELDAARIHELLTGSDLFGNKKKIFLENLSGCFKGKKRDEIRNMLLTEENDNLFVLEEKFDVKFYQGMSVSKSEIKLPVLIFNYLDSLGSPQGVVLKNYMAVTQIEAVEKVFRMTVLRLQDLMRIKSNPKKYDLSKYYWKKIYQQSQRMSFEVLSELYFELYKIDKESKTGSSPVDLSTRLELFWQLYRL